MATRFGGVSPAQTYATKVRWLVGCLLSVIVVLVFAVVFIAQNSEARRGDEAAPEQQQQAVAPQQPQGGFSDVLIAVQRIEQSDRLERHMFTTASMEEKKIPVAAYRAKDLDAIIGQYATRLISPNEPLLLEHVTKERPINPLSIPPGYRAVTITVDARSGVEGFAKPNTRVDVLWTYMKDGKQAVATIVRFTKILSVAGQTGTEAQRAAVSGNATTVTLLVTEKDSKKIELARTLGTLSLALVGETDNGPKEADPDSITIADLIGQKAGSDGQAQQEVSTDGVMYTTDQKTGKQMRYILVNGRWQLDKNY